VRRFAGQVDGCDYSLVAAGTQYKGAGHCGDTEVPVQIAIELPEAVADFTKVKQAEAGKV
jgi:hypothetical protein